MRAQRCDEGGYVMAAALASLFAMSIVAAGLVATSTSELRRIRAVELAAAEDAALEGALALAVAEIALPTRRRSLGFRSGRAEVRVAGRDVVVALGWESDKIDLNAASRAAVDARLEAGGVTDMDRLVVMENLERARSSSGAVRLVDDVLRGVAQPECIRRFVTVFGGREEWASGQDGERNEVGQPAPGARVVLRAQTGRGASARGREIVVLMTGDPSAPARVMDVRRVRGDAEEACDAA